MERRPSHLLAFVFLVGICLTLGPSLRASGTASNITGLYYTGDTAGGTGLAAGGTTDGNWALTYASTSGGRRESSAYEGAAYVVSPTYVDGAWTQNTGSAQWITAPGAVTTSGTNANTGGDDLPGNGTSGTNEGIYIYTLAFTISGTGSGTVTNHIGISLTIAADDAYYVYVNPTGSGQSLLSTSSADASGTNAWNNTSAITLSNYTDTTNGFTNNSTFVIGTNYLVIEVVNSNSISGTSASTALNPSGLLVYQVGNVALINGHPVPEMTTWLPLAIALVMGGLLAWWKGRNVGPAAIGV